MSQAAAVGCWVVGLGVFGPREPRPRDPSPPWSPIPLQARAAYGWLALSLALPGGYFGPGQDTHLRVAFANADRVALAELPARLRDFG